MFILHLVSYVATCAGFLFVLLSLASGLLYVAEVIEEHSALAKTVGQRMIYSVIALLIILAITDGLPLHIATIGIISHLVYLQNFSRTWPIIPLSSYKFIASVLLVITSHWISFTYWSERAKEPRHFSYYANQRKSSGGWGRGSSTPADDTFMDIATYFGICVWLVPFYLFLSLSANDNVLPSAGEVPPTPTGRTSTRQHGQSHERKPSSMVKTALATAFSFFPTSLRGSKKSALPSPLSLSLNLPNDRRNDGYNPSPRNTSFGTPGENGTSTSYGNDPRYARTSSPIPYSPIGGRYPQPQQQQQQQQAGWQTPYSPHPHPQTGSPSPSPAPGAGQQFNQRPSQIASPPHLGIPGMAPRRNTEGSSSSSSAGVFYNTSPPPQQRSTSVAMQEERVASPSPSTMMGMSDRNGYSTIAAGGAGGGGGGGITKRKVV